MSVRGRDRRAPRWYRPSRQTLILPRIIGGAVVSTAGGVPAYIEAMAPFDVLRLSNTAPSNGNDTIADVTPSEWITSDPGASDLPAIINEWCGGFKGSGSIVTVHGGGHGGSANNSVPGLDLAGTSAATGWAMVAQPSAVADVVANVDAYSDGRPCSVHTYDGCVRVGSWGYRFGGALYSGGNFTNGSWKFNYSTGAWTQLTSANNLGGTMATTVYDAGSGKILVIPCLAPSQAWRFLDTSNDMWAGTDVPGEYAPYEAVSALDTSRNRVLTIGSDGGSRRNTLTTPTWGSNTVSVATQALSGLASGMIAGLSLLYDPLLDCYWCWGGTSASGDYANLYRINASTFAITSHALSQTLAQHDGSSQGSYGRWCFNSDWRAIGFVTHTNSAAGSHIIKLPSS